MSVISKYKKQIKEIEEKIKNIQKSCTHPEDVVMRKYSCNSGNYDPSNDSESQTFCCLLCGYKWYDHRYTSGYNEPWHLPDNERYRRSNKILPWDDDLIPE